MLDTKGNLLAAAAHVLMTTRQSLELFHKAQMLHVCIMGERNFKELPSSLGSLHRGF